MPSSKMRSRPQVYPRLSFHIVRTIAFISASIISGILIYFMIQLKHDDFKLPWTFIIVLAASLISFFSLFISTILYSCFFLSPLLSLIFNVSVLIIYLVGYGLLTWNIYGTLGHSCSRANWASDDGMMICRTYKAFYSFEVFGLLAQFALVVLDVRSRRAQTRGGTYDRMGNAGLAKGGVKMDDLPAGDRSVDSRPGMHGHADSQDSIPYGIEYNESRTRLRDNAADYGHTAPPVRMQDFRSNSGYNSYEGGGPPGHANNGYGYGPQR